MKNEEINVLIQTQVENDRAKESDFPSPHHGFGIIKENKEELEAELGEIHTSVKELWHKIKYDSPRGQKQTVRELKNNTVNLIDQSIKLAAAIERYDLLLR